MSCPLQELVLPNNRLSGTIPTSYASLTLLEVLRLGHNQLQGPLPSTFVSLRHLAVLDVSGNTLTGVYVLCSSAALPGCSWHAKASEELRTSQPFYLLQ